MSLAELRPIADESGLVLRVLAGRSVGAVLQLRADAPTGIGGDFTSDVVLQDSTARDVRLSLQPRGAAATLTVNAGEIVLLGQHIGAPSEIILPAFVPFAVGGAVLAYGAAGDARWADAEHLLDLLDAGTAANSDEPLALQAPAGRLPLARLLTWGAPVGFAALGAVLVLGLVGGGALVTTERKPSVATLRGELDKAGLHGLRLDEPQPGRLVVSGLVSDNRAAAAVVTWARRQKLPVTVALQTNQGLSRALEDDFRSRGVDGSVSIAGPGVFDLTIHGGDAASAADVRRRILQDMRDVRDVRIRMESDTALGSTLPDALGRPVTAVVAGEAGYVATADGGRYFVGSTLANGDRILSIHDHQVDVGRAGRTLSLTF